MSLRIRIVFVPFWLALFSTQADAIVFKQVTITEKLKEAEHFDRVVVVRAISSFGMTTLNEITFPTVHKYEVRPFGTDKAVRTICINDRIAAGNEILIARMPERLPSGNAPRDEAINRECSGDFYDASFGYEVLRIEAQFFDGTYARYLRLPSETYKLNPECTRCFTEERKVTGSSGKLVYTDDYYHVPLSEIDLDKLSRYEG